MVLFFTSGAAVQANRWLRHTHTQTHTHTHNVPPGGARHQYYTQVSSIAQHRTEQSRNTASNTTQNSKSNIKLRKHQSDFIGGFYWDDLTNTERPRFVLASHFTSSFILRLTLFVLGSPSPMISVKIISFFFFF